MKRYFGLLLLLVLATAAVGRAQDLDDQYLQIFGLIQEGDTLSATQPAQALAKYNAAQDGLIKLQKQNSAWNASVVSFRLSYVADRIKTLAAKLPATSATTNSSATASSSGAKAAPVPTAAPSAPSDWEAQLNGLKDQVHQLQADKSLLEAKLKEAFAAQPAQVDPREMTKAEDKITSLQKENDLLKTTLEQEKAKAAAPSVNAKTLQQSQQALAESNRQLAAQKDLVAKLTQEKLGLQERVQTLTAGSEKTAALLADNQALRKQLSEAKAAPVASAKRDENAGQLAGPNQELAAQKELVSQLTLERDALQGRVKTLSSSSAKVAALRSENEALKKQLAEAQAAKTPGTNAEESARQLAELNHELAAQKDIDAKLASEKTALEGQLKTLEGQTQKTDALRAENEALKKQVADNKTASALAVKGEQTSKQLVEAQTQINSLKSEKDALLLRKTALENQLKTLSATTATNRVLAPSSSSEDLAQIRELEHERDTLQKKLDAADKALYGRKGKVVAGRVGELENELATMRARLEVFEARQVPYSAEELALLKTPATVAKEPSPNAVKSVRELPSGSAKQIDEAQSYFAAKQYEKAEAIYNQLLQQDPKNVPLLANLAAVQVEARHFDAADANLRQALNTDADDSYSLYVLGILRYRQARYDAALDALSRSAKLDAQNADIQNYLGLTLTEKGMRNQAETAFRKAVELRPNFGSAHVNLAVFYITQNPPYAALARWHYQKALDSGHPHNPTLEKMLEDKK